LGVRVALGAQQRAIFWLVVGQSVRFALTGTALGLIVALAQSGWIQPLLFHQSATDPWILAGVAGAMLVVALAAGAAPAWRAARADPNAALRAE
jgi:ABC-type lipoprotein release transport system permease subunit